MVELPAKVKEDALKRMRRIEGQARGVQRMIEEGRDCHEILHQLAAIRSAVYQTSLLLARSYAVECLHDPGGKRSPEEMINELVGMLAKMSH
jgi:DNA-binding FrmR family transcriptional regulator